jgi:hypothetical protein
MTDAHFRYLKPQVLLSLIVLLAISLYLTNQYITASIGHNISITGIIVGVFLLIDRYLWKYPPFKWLYWVPDMSGRYEGVVHYEHPITRSPDSKNCAVEVFQTGSKLKVSCFFQHQVIDEPSTSKSLVESIIKEEDDCHSLVFTYQNEGARSLGQPHSGTNILKFINNGEGKFLKGHYYTNRDPQTKGLMEVKYQSNNLKNDF